MLLVVYSHSGVVYSCLSHGGQNFQCQLNRARQELTQSSLSDPSLFLIEITMLLGSAQQSAFNEAFR
ncbi:MAG: hypothetical protein ACFE0K_10620 [Alcanivorax sp.]|uniref:hypothetical protein n=1 Tax=Alcanivorax sp. TaxID=1872427 RepID=UPI003DA730E3